MKLVTFEQTLTGGFSCVKTRIAFDTKILLPNSKEKTEDVLSKDYNYKVCYRLKFGEDKNWATKGVISKILNYENNQYGYAMTNLCQRVVLKKEPEPTWRTFNILVERVDLKDPVGHSFVVDISFGYGKATPRQRIYNAIYPSITEKQKIIDVAERSVHQLMEQYTH